MDIQQIQVALELLLTTAAVLGVAKSLYNGYLRQIVEGLSALPHVAEQVERLTDVQLAQLEAQSDPDAEVPPDVAREHLGREDRVEPLIERNGDGSEAGRRS